MAVVCGSGGSTSGGRGSGSGYLTGVGSGGGNEKTPNQRAMLDHP